MNRRLGIDKGDNSTFAGRETEVSTTMTTPHHNKENEPPCVAGPHYSVIRVIGNGAFGKYLYKLMSLSFEQNGLIIALL